VYEEISLFPGQFVEETTGVGFVLFEAFELSSQPAQHNLVDVLKQRPQRRKSVSAVVSDPAPKERIEYTEPPPVSSPSPSPAAR
jgi:hypothetical protein